MKKIIFFDRDGTLIKNIPYLNDASKIEFFPDTISTLQKLKNKGYEFIIVTNQSGIPRGLITNEQLIEIHQRLLTLFNEHNIEILEIYHSPHLPESNHPHRKPNPGMILKAFKKYNIDKTNSYMVGDNISDGLAGVNAGLKSYVLNHDNPQFTKISNLKDLLLYI